MNNGNSNHQWRKPNPGDVCGSGFVDNGRFGDIYDGESGIVRRFWNFDTLKDDIATLGRLKGNREARRRRTVFAERERSAMSEDCKACAGEVDNHSQFCPLANSEAASSLAAPTGSVRTWTVKRIVEELYSVDASTRAEAIERVAVKGDPYSVKIKSETATINN